jgi:hypothetical protein
MALSPVARSLVLPEQQPAFHISDGFAARKTAVANPFSEYAITPQPLGGNGNAYFAGFFFRDPLRAAMIVDPNPSSANCRYDFVFTTSVTGTSEVAPAVPPGQTVWIQPNYLLHNPYVSTYAPHGSILYCGENGSDVFVWIDFNVYLNIQTGSVTTANNQVTLSLWSWNGRQKIKYGDYNVDCHVNQLQRFQVLDPGYYAISVSGVGSGGSDSTAAVQFSNVFLDGYNACYQIWAHKPLPGFDDNYVATKEIRIQSIGVTWRNTTAFEYLNGQATIVQMSKGDDPQYYVNDGFPLNILYTTLSGLKNAQTTSFKKSLYTYIKPLCSDDFKYLRPSVTDVAFGSSFETGQVGYFSLRPAASWVALVAQVLYPSGGGVGSTATQFRHTCGIEYETTNNWRATKEPDVDESALSDACKELATLPQIFDDEGSKIKL